MIPIIEEPALRSAIAPGDAIRAVREAFRADGEGRTTVPAVINLPVPEVHGEFHVKTARIAGIPYVAVKVASGFYDNPARGLPSGSGLMLLFDADTGLPVALLFDNGYLTDVRTGAAGAVAADVLARTEIDTVGVVGSGVQARHQIACLREVRRFRRLVAWSPDRAGLDAYLAEAGERWTLETRAEEGAEPVCRAADVLITATPAREPFVRAEWLKPGTHVTALGADSPGKQELHADCLARADLVVVDRKSQCAAFGELRAALEAGALTLDRVHAELGEIVAGHREGRTRDDQVTVADLTGVGFQDTAIAAAAFDAVRRAS
jgi:ornithine cyclodeaminase/alanine dehydrogenase-like protein (mu-crystallin family)